ncbi:MAG: hypothetical protein ACOZAL_01765 [Patescibacteria group bacterium]
MLKLFKKSGAKRNAKNLLGMIVESLKEKGADMDRGFRYEGNPAAIGYFHTGRITIRICEDALETILDLPGNTQLARALQTKVRQKYGYGGYTVVTANEINSVNPEEIAKDLCETILYYERIQKETAEIGKEIDAKIREIIEKLNVSEQKT